MVDIQSPTAEIRRGKKEETGHKYNVRICYAETEKPTYKDQVYYWIVTSIKCQPLVGGNAERSLYINDTKLFHSH